MNVLHLRMILNAVAMLICAGGAAMLIPAAYSLLKAPEEAWIFWSPGVIEIPCDRGGAGPAICLTSTPPRRVAGESLAI